MENELELVIKTKTLGVLKTNALAIKEKVAGMLDNYKAENYNKDNIEKAKSDKATLNNTAKKLNDARIQLEKEFMKPFNDDFKDIITDTCSMIKEASLQIDVIVKDVENKTKEEKKKEIEKIFNDNVKDLEKVVSLDSLFDDRWLNKGFDIKDIETTIKDRLDTIRKDLDIITCLKSKFETELKANYLENFNLGRIILKNNELLEKEKALIEQGSITQEVIKQNEIEKMNAQAEKVVLNLEENIMTFSLKVTGTESQLKALRKFIDTNHMTYEKL